MKKTLLILTFIININVYSQNLELGLKIQKTHLMYWENGITLRYSFNKLFNNQLYFGFEYVSSRYGTAYESNALNQDSYTLTTTWYYFKKQQLNIFSQFNFGYFFADLEEDFFKELPHTAFLLSPEFGVSYNFRRLPISINIGVGYYINMQEEGESPGTLQPLHYYSTISYKLFNKE